MSIQSCACIETLSVCVNTSYHWNWKSFFGHGLHTSVSKNCTQIRPLLRKSSPDHANFKNFRRVSVFRLFLKSLRKVSAFSLIANYIETNDLRETYHSAAYKSLHSTETALLRVHEGILGAIDNSRSVALLLLDLSAAFDRIDHGILLHRLEFCFGIKGSAPRHMHARKNFWHPGYIKQRIVFKILNW